MAWNRKGTITIPSVLTDVIGLGTTWIQDGIESGDIFTVNSGTIYEIDQAVTDTLIRLKTPYSAVISSASSFSIIPHSVKAGATSAFVTTKIIDLLANWKTRDSELQNWITSQADTVTITTSDGSTPLLPTPAYLSRMAASGSLAVTIGTDATILTANASGSAVRSGWLIDSNGLRTTTSKMGTYPIALNSQTVVTTNSQITLDMSAANFFVVEMSGKNISNLLIINTPTVTNTVVFGTIEFKNTSSSSATITDFAIGSLKDQAISTPITLVANQVLTVSFYTYNSLFRFTPTLVS
jgi:hypothetical protein